MITTQDSQRKSLRGLGALGCVILACVALVATCQDSHKTPLLTADEQDVFAVVIRDQMEGWIRDADKNEAEAKTKVTKRQSDKAIAHHLNFPVFFVQIAGADPTDDFLNRFRDLPRTVLKVSREQAAKEPHTPVEKSTHRSGIVFSADTIKWISKNSAEVEGGYYCGGLCAAGITFFVQRENGKWIVKSSRTRWIS